MKKYYTNRYGNNNFLAGYVVLRSLISYLGEIGRYLGKETKTCQLGNIVHQNQILLKNLQEENDNDK